ncbi:MAG: LysR family transcriptional regulator [Myxococcota bacterium]
MNLESWDDLRFVLALAQHQTLTAAAAALGVDQSTVTRRLKACEDRLGIKLFNRLRNGRELTPAGAALSSAAADIEERLFALEREISSTHVEYSPVKLTLSQPLAALWIERFDTFAREHPQLELQLIVDNEYRNLDRREADVALRRAKSPPEHLVGRRLGEVADALYGAHTLMGRPLEELPWYGWERGLDDSLLERARQTYSPSQTFSLYANSFYILREAARRGLTALTLACVVGDADRELVRLTEPVVSESSLWILTHPDTRTSPSVRLVIDFVAGFIREQRPALLGATGDPT